MRVIDGYEALVILIDKTKKKEIQTISIVACRKMLNSR